MIAAANRDIRRHLRLAELRRAQISHSPFAYLDQMIADLESLHLDGLRLVPSSFAPTLFAVNRMLPTGVAPLPERRGLIRDAIDQCFELQERLTAPEEAPTLPSPVNGGGECPAPLQRGRGMS